MGQQVNTQKYKEREQKVPLSVAGIRAGGAFLTGVSERTRLRALTATTHAAAPPAAHLPIVRNARRRLGGAVTVVTDVTGVTFTFPTVTLAVTWGEKTGSSTAAKQTQMHRCHTLFTKCERSSASYENLLAALIPLCGSFSHVQQQPTIICYINVT